ncbi:MAG: enoyl-CoA hydratase/isomerase family protein [Blastocatellia bacterium]
MANWQWSMTLPYRIFDMSPAILLTQHDHYAIITLNRSAQLHRLARAMMEELAEFIERLREADDLRVLIVTGAGGVFSAGADLGEVATLDPATAFDFSRRGQAILASFGEVAPVTIAAIDGHCLGGGLDIAMSCDLRYATPRATFQHPGAKRGIITGWSGTQTLPRIVGIDAARRLLVTGDRIDAEEALRIGLINKICEDALNYSHQFAERIAAKFTQERLSEIKRGLEFNDWTKTR